MSNLPAADLLRTWAYRALLGKSDAPNPYPLAGASAYWKSSPESASLFLPDTGRTPRSRPRMTKVETRCKILDLGKKLAGAVSEAKAVLDHGTDSEFTMLAMELEAFVRSAVSQIVEAVERGPGSVKAAETLAFCALNATNELQKLGRKRSELVKPVAENWAMWPVLYDPHPDGMKELEAETAALGVATKSPERRRGKWSNRPAKDQPNRAAVGKYANRMAQTLRRIHGDGNLAQVLRLNPAGWPGWVVSAVHLDPLRKDTAPQWFDVAWQMLAEAAGGDVTTIKGLFPVGESNADFAKRRATTAKGKSGSQTSRRESDIRKALRKAFLARFGN